MTSCSSGSSRALGRSALPWGSLESQRGKGRFSLLLKQPHNLLSYGNTSHPKKLVQAVKNGSLCSLNVFCFPGHLPPLQTQWETGNSSDLWEWQVFWGTYLKIQGLVLLSVISVWLIWHFFYCHLQNTETGNELMNCQSLPCHNEEANK